MTRSSRSAHGRDLVALSSRALPDGTVALRSPAVGVWTSAREMSAIVLPGSTIGEVAVLGVSSRIVAPSDGFGRVVKTVSDEAAGKRRVAVGYGEVLLVLDPSGAGVHQARSPTASVDGTTKTLGLIFRSPTSGRFYGRPAPSKPPFVQVGDEVTTGRTLCMLEVMKTFHRVVYTNEGGLPERARIRAVLQNDGADLRAGDAIFEIERVD